jgi:hypothetical protein
MGARSGRGNYCEASRENPDAKAARTGAYIASSSGLRQLNVFMTS